MAELKTQRNQQDVSRFLDGIWDSNRRQDAWEVLRLMQKVTGKPPEMWGDSIVGFGSSGKSCLYIRQLSDGDKTVLPRLIEASVAEVRRREKREGGS